MERALRRQGIKVSLDRTDDIPDATNPRLFGRLAWDRQRRCCRGGLRDILLRLEVPIMLRQLLALDGDELLWLRGLSRRQLPGSRRTLKPHRPADRATGHSHHTVQSWASEGWDNVD